MNDELKKNAKYRKRYMQKKRMLCVCLDKEKDKDLIEWLNRQACISESVKRKLRENTDGEQQES